MTAPIVTLRNRYFLATILLPCLAAPRHAESVQPYASQILGKVQTTVNDEHAFVGSYMLPSVDEGVVTLTGTVRSEAERVSRRPSSPTSPQR